MQKFLASSLFLTCMLGSALATPITWSNSFFPTAFSSGTDLGFTSHNFTSDAGGVLLPVTSLTLNNMPVAGVVGTTTYTQQLGTALDLGWQNLGAPGAEHGLGIWDAIHDAEIRKSSALQINLSGITFTNVAFTLDSINSGNTTAGEGYRIWGSATAGGVMTLIAQSTFSTGGFVQTKTFNNTYKFFEITSNTPTDGLSSVVLRSVATDAVPEPSTYAMLGMGMLALGIARRKFAK